MKKELIICIIVIILIIALNIITANHTKNVMNEITQELDKVREKIISETDKDINQELQTIQDKWEEKNTCLAYYIEHDELEKIGLYLTETKSNIEREEYNMAIQNIDSTKFIIKHIKDKYQFTLKNIF